MAWTKTGTPDFVVERSHRIPTFSATRWDGRFSGAVMAIKRSTPRPLAKSRHARAPSVAMPVPLAGRNDVVPDLEILRAVQRLPREPTVAQELSVGVFNHPQPEAVPGVVVTCPFDPGPRFGSRLRPRVEAHHIFVPEQSGHRVEGFHRDLPEVQQL